jgi:hypothetical protein
MTTSPDVSSCQSNSDSSRYRRYGAAHLVSTSIQRATPMILRAVEQVNDRAAMSA